MKAFAQFGFAVWMLILMCLLSLACAGWFASRGGARRLRVVIAVSTGAFFTTLAATFMGIVTTGRWLAHFAGSPPNPARMSSPSPGSVALTGLSEALAGGVMGFGTLTVVALIVAVALWRGVTVE
jgi:hypothetical protein